MTSLLLWRYDISLSFWRTKSLSFDKFPRFWVFLGLSFWNSVPKKALIYVATKTQLGYLRCMENLQLTALKMVCCCCPSKGGDLVIQPWWRIPLSTSSIFKNGLHIRNKPQFLSDFRGQNFFLGQKLFHVLAISEPWCWLTSFTPSLKFLTNLLQLQIIDMSLHCPTFIEMIRLWHC